MDKLRIQMVGKTDVDGNDYYFTSCEAPVMVNLEKTVIHVFPDEDPEKPGHFWAELVIRKFDGKHSKRPKLSRRRRKKQPEIK